MKQYMLDASIAPLFYFSVPAFGIWRDCNLVKIFSFEFFLVFIYTSIMLPISLITKFIPGSTFNQQQTSDEEEFSSETEPVIQNEEETEWREESPSGELEVYVYETCGEIVVVSAIAGVARDDIDIDISNDMVTIRGVRTAPDALSPKDYLYNEC